MSTDSVPKDVLVAFGVPSTAVLKPLPGGSLVCYLADDVVFRPSEDDPESEQIAEILMKLRGAMPSKAEYRISRPIPVTTCSTQFVFGGWTAWSFLSGGGRDTVIWAESLRACRAFHRDIGSLDIEKPEFLDRRLNRFRQADRVAWGEVSRDQLPAVQNPKVLSRINGPLKRLADLTRPFSHPLPNQLVHGDIGGNMLFDGAGEPPGVIDMTFYWRPAGYGAAIMICDGLMWHKEGAGLVESYGMSADDIQLIVRALLFRIVTWAIDMPVASTASDADWVDRFLPVVDFDGAVDTVAKFIS